MTYHHPLNIETKHVKPIIPPPQCLFTLIQFEKKENAIATDGVKINNNNNNKRRRRQKDDDRM